jgi:hypothetical protein
MYLWAKQELLKNTITKLRNLIKIMGVVTDNTPMVIFLRKRWHKVDLCILQRTHEMRKINHIGLLIIDTLMQNMIKFSLFSKINSQLAGYIIIVI